MKHGSPGGVEAGYLDHFISIYSSGLVWVVGPGNSQSLLLHALSTETGSCSGLGVVFDHRCYAPPIIPPKISCRMMRVLVRLFNKFNNLIAASNFLDVG